MNPLLFLYCSIMKCSKGKLCVLALRALKNNDEELGLLSLFSQTARLRILVLFSYTQDRLCHVEALGCFGGEADLFSFRDSPSCTPNSTVTERSGLGKD